MNTWVRYIDRNFSNIKASVTTSLKNIVPELEDYSLSNLLIVIVDMFAGIAELINYYIDTTARELFLPTARRLSSVIKLADIAGYNCKARTAAYTTVTFSITPIPAPIDFLIPAGTLLNDSLGYRWVTQHNQFLRGGFTSTLVEVAQTESVSDNNLGVTSSDPTQIFPLPSHYKDSSISITINSVLWTLVDSLGFSKATDKHFIVKMYPDGILYVVFGNDANGAIPGSGFEVLASYNSTVGATGNVPIGSIVNIVSVISLPAGVNDITVTNENPATGGRAIEGIEEIRKAIPISLRTLDRAVTKKDYEDVAVLSADIRAARVEWAGNATIKVFLVAHGGGNPTQAILDSTKDFIEARSMMTIPVETYPSGESHVRGSVTIVGKYRATASVIETKVLTALQELYNPYTSNINQDIRTSDIIAAIDNIPEVDYLSLDSIYIQPYLRPSNAAAPLDYNINILVTSQEKTNWKIAYVSADAEPFYIYKDGIFLAKMAAETTESNVGGLLNISINTAPGAVVNGDYWEFVVYPYGVDIDLDDLSIPVVVSGDFALTVNQSYTPI